ncbi:PKD domain-containing protein [Flavobacterium kingsejongi]|uniref:PKD domain-containing protein n=1 Tax=Flavobacterium kingsejongi TaxID=1678728 RepID=A0A2S1LPZ0_9FLAO|nr:PKD domain-containing protein [Flavobacterium kingsejongi]AWG25820.1 PKD domain-containing protein [Flavobacterium kingsejongi]
MNIKNKTVVIILLCIAVSLIIIALLFPFNKKLSNLDFSILDKNDNHQYELNEKLSFKINDSTLLSDKKAVWYFGNGDSIVSKENVDYTYKKAGKYLVTLRINNKFDFSKQINIVNGRTLTAKDSIPKIFCAAFGYVGEEIVFTGYSPSSNNWYWEFGETGTIDSYEKQAIYVFTSPGIYTIKLETEKTKYPITKEIEIFQLYEPFKEPEVIDSAGIVLNDIKKRLQIIANLGARDTRAYKAQVNYLKNKYICSDLSDVVVVVNEEKYNDFLSYCQGLHYLDGNATIIQEVKLDTIKCFRQINITQKTNKTK